VGAGFGEIRGQKPLHEQEESEPRISRMARVRNELGGGDPALELKAWSRACTTFSKSPTVSLKGLSLFDMIILSRMRFYGIRAVGSWLASASGSRRLWTAADFPTGKIPSHFHKS
jgi:hypothetical protein